MDNLYFTIIMVVWCVFLLAAILIYFGGAQGMPAFDHADIKDRKDYGRRFAKMFAFMSLALPLSGLVSFIGIDLLTVVVLIGGLIYFGIVGYRKYIKGHYF